LMGRSPQCPKPSMLRLPCLLESCRRL
jgi:hypothetical protein